MGFCSASRGGLLFSIPGWAFVQHPGVGFCSASRGGLSFSIPGWAFVQHPGVGFCSASRGGLFDWVIMSGGHLTTHNA